MPGTTTPEQEPFEQVTRRAAALGVEHRDVGRVPEPRAHLGRHVVERVLAQEALQVALLPEPGEELLVARPVGRGDHLGDHVGPVRRARAAPGCRARPRSGSRRTTAAGWSAPRGPGRSTAAGVALDHLVRGQVLAREQPAALEHPVAAGAAPRRPCRGSRAPRRRAGRAGRPARGSGSASPSRSSSPPGRVELRALGLERKIGARISNRKACIGDHVDALARRRAPVRRSARRAARCRSARAPAPGRAGCRRHPQEDGPTLKRCTASSEKWMSIGVSAAGSSSRARARAPRRRSRAGGPRPPAVCDEHEAAGARARSAATRRPTTSARRHRGVDRVAAGAQHVGARLAR